MRCPWLSIVQIVHYPVNHQPARHAALELLSLATGRQLTRSRLALNAATVVLYTCTLSISLVREQCGASVQARERARRPLTPPANRPLDAAPSPGSPLSPVQLVTDLGQVFKLIGGTCGAFFIFGIPGALLLQVLAVRVLRGQWGGGGQRPGHPCRQRPNLRTHPTSARPPTPLPLQYAYSKYLQASEAGEVHEPLLEGGEGATPAPPPKYHYLTSKLWWAGVGLILLALALLGLTMYSLVHPLY